MTALDCQFLSVHTELEHVYRNLVIPVDISDDDEHKPTKLAAIFDDKLYNELNEKLAECVSSALKGKSSCYYRFVTFYSVAWNDHQHVSFADLH